ncbi:MAG: hypothetical protein P4K83_12580 [Terracidiphilus sp.]|nr:hypothetical protein [Terracidiphilus sp.]
MKLSRVLFAVLILTLCRTALPAQAADQGAQNAAQARAAIDAMVKALGGEAWLEMKNQERHGFLSAFFQGQPNLGTTEYWEFHQWPAQDRIEITKHRDVLQFYIDRTAWEVTYKGKKALPEEIATDYLRRRDHSIETAVKVWLKDPNTILIYEGKQMAGSHLCDQVTLISAENESVTILTDTSTHLPLRRVFQWRDPVYKDKNTDAEEYDNYRPIDGIQTPLRITRYKNNDILRQYYIDRVTFNQSFDAGFWDVDAAARRVKK